MVVAIHTVIAIAVVVALIIWLKVDPVLSLLVGCLYLGLAGGVTLSGTVSAITEGFGDIMVKVGLLIGFGVLIGALLHAMGAFRKLVQVLVRVFGASRMPYAMTIALSTIFPSIYVDVQVVLASPVARSTAPHLGSRGLARMSSAVGVGIFSGYVFVLPGLAAISIAGLLRIELGTWLMYGFVLGPLVAVLTTILYGILLRTGWWNRDRDEESELGDASGGHEPAEQSEVASEPDTLSDLPAKARQMSLGVLMLPVAIPLVLIATAAILKVLKQSNNVIAFLGNANIALFLGLLLAFGLARYALGAERTQEVLSDGFRTSGEILLVTGIGGSLGEVITATGLDTVLASLFSAQEGASVIVSVVLAWFVAVVLHVAIGSVSVAAITAGGILAPVLSSIQVSPLAIGFAVAAGSLFAVHVNSNFFWMFKSLMGLSTTGALKSLTTVTGMASLVALPLVVLMAFVIPR